MGYTLAEIRGQHHSMFCTAEFAKSREYRDFWADLNDGAFKSGRFKRIGARDVEVWIQATYNPILDLDGKPYKVVKFAMEITTQVDREQAIANNVSAISGVMDGLSGSITSIADGSQRSTRLASQTQREADDGSKLLKRSRESIIAIQEVVEGHPRDHRHHQRDRRPDAPARLQRGDRGGARRRARHRLLGGGRGGAQAGREVGAGDARDLQADQRDGQARGRGRPPVGRRRGRVHAHPALRGRHHALDRADPHGHQRAGEATQNVTSLLLDLQISSQNG